MNRIFFLKSGNFLSICNDPREGFKGKIEHIKIHFQLEKHRIKTNGVSVEH